MSSLLVDGLLKTIAMFHPEYAPMIDFVINHEDQIEKLAPIAAAAEKEGPGAFAAAEEHAPELATAIKNFVDSIPGTAANAAEAQATIAKHREIVTRHMTGAAQAQAAESSTSWMDENQTTSTDSRVGGN
jgi:hypothetical protein